MPSASAFRDRGAHEARSITSERRLHRGRQRRLGRHRLLRRLAPTPRIDALAGEGLRFRNYNVEAQCTPTRSAILSGRLPIRTGNCSVPLPGHGPWRGHFGSGFEGGMRAPAMVRWPGRTPAGVVTDEIMTTVEWLPTLASLIGESARVPTDRPIDGVDVSAFLRGDSSTTGRDHVISFGSDAAVMSVKWRTIKVVFRYGESTSGPIVKPQWPLIFDLIDDPVEEWDLIENHLEGAWALGPVAARLGALQQSAARYPHIRPGEDFTGYS